MFFWHFIITSATQSSTNQHNLNLSVCRSTDGLSKSASLMMPIHWNHFAQHKRIHLYGSNVSLLWRMHWMYKYFYSSFLYYCQTLCLGNTKISCLWLIALCALLRCLSIYWRHLSISISIYLSLLYNYRVHPFNGNSCYFPLTLTLFLQLNLIINGFFVPTLC